MTQHVIFVLVTDGRAVPARVCGMLAQRDIEIVGIQINRTHDAAWAIHLVVEVPSESDLERVTKYLNRMVDVVKVLVLSGRSHCRRSLFVTARPAAADMIYLSELARAFGAEVLSASSSVVTVHLSADPDRCDQFLALVQPYGVIDVVLGAVAGIRDPTKGASAVETRRQVAAR